MYVAVRRIKGPKGWIEAGEAIPDTDNLKLWPMVPLKACINLGLIKKVSDESSLPAASEVDAQKHSGAAQEILGCPRCPDKTFKSKGGLASHMKSHR